MIRSQKQQIEAYIHFKDKEMSVFSLIWFNRRIYAIILPLALISIFGLSLANNESGAWLLSFGYAALLLRDFSYYRRAASVWPLMQQILDWQKIADAASTGGIKAA